MRSSRSALLPSSTLWTPIFSSLIFCILPLCILLASTLSLAAAPDRITSQIDSSQTVRLAAGVPRNAQPQYDRGSVDPSLKLSYITLHTVPTPSQQKAINLLLAQQQDPSSPLYHKWLTPEQYADRFSLSPNDVQKITSWLSEQGFAIIKVARSRNLIAFSGTAAQAEQAFRPQLHAFNINGENHFSNTAPPSIPSALAGIVAGVGGLNDFRPKPFFQRRNPNYSYPIPSSSPTQYVPLLAPGDIGTIYNITPLYSAATPITGAGQKLVVVGQTDVYLADLNDFRSGFVLPNISCTTNSSDIITACNDAHFKYVLNGPDAGVNPDGDDLVEADIDLEWSGAIAYGAQLIYVNSGGTANGVWDAWHTAVTDNLAPVITMSYGICELGEALGDVGGNTFSSDESLLQQANLQGITFMNSSGDTGAAACDSSPPGAGNPVPPYGAAVGGLSVNYPASSPEVTGVGGTMIPLAELTDPGTYWTTSTAANGSSAVCPNSTGPCIPENGWNDDQEFGDYCAATSDPNACFPTGTGQVQITSPKTFQEDFWIGSSGGGPSNCYTFNTTTQACSGGFPQPTWQQNLDIPGQTTKAHVTAGIAAVRFSPDVSLLASADYPGFIVCTAQSELVQGGTSASSCTGGGATGISNSISNYGSIFGGTSFASPIFAGIVTLLNQYLGSGTPGLGSINAQLYSLAKNAPTAFNQVTAGDTYGGGSNTVYDCEGGTPSGFPAADQCPSTGPNAGTMGYLANSADPATGYDLVTGLGSVNVNNLFQAWAAAETSSSVTVQASKAQILLGQSVTLTATVLPSTATGQVSFFNNGSTTALGTVTIDGSSGGVAAFSTTALPLGTDDVTASFFGSGYNTASTSAAPAVVLVTAPTFTWTTSSTSHTVMAGQTTEAYSFTATPTGGAATFAGQVTFSCSFSPTDTTLANSSCVFNPTSIAAGTASTGTPVTMTITTAGPNTGTGSAVRRRADGRPRSPWLPLTLPLAGAVLLGVMRGRVSRKVAKHSAIALMGFSLVLLGFMVSCGGGGSSSSAPVSVTLSANPTSIWPNNTNWPSSTTTLTAVVSNTSNTAVTWSMPTVGSLTPSGDTATYTAPTEASGLPSTVTVTATSQADTSKSGSATITLKTPTLPQSYTVTVTATEAGTPHTQMVTMAVN